MINPLKARKLIKQLNNGLCQKCRLKLFNYTRKNSDKVKGKDFFGINNDMADMPICDKCKENVMKVMGGFKGDIGGN